MTFSASSRLSLATSKPLTPLVMLYSKELKKAVSNSSLNAMSWKATVDPGPS